LPRALSAAARIASEFTTRAVVAALVGFPLLRLAEKVAEGRMRCGKPKRAL
jgi:hypothetical protein